MSETRYNEKGEEVKKPNVHNLDYALAINLNAEWNEAKTVKEWINDSGESWSKLAHEWLAQLQAVTKERDEAIKYIKTSHWDRYDELQESKQTSEALLVSLQGVNADNKKLEQEVERFELGIEIILNTFQTFEGCGELVRTKLKELLNE